MAAAERASSFVLIPFTGRRASLGDVFRRGYFIGHPGFWGWAARLLPLLLFAVVLALAAFAIVRLFDRGAGHHGAPGPYPPMPPVDQAVAQARYRYANGQLSREEYFRLLVDLGAAPPGPPPWPPAPEATVGGPTGAPPSTP